MQDCEWKLRATERSCKDKLTIAEKIKNDALAKMNDLEEKAAQQSREV